MEIIIIVRRRKSDLNNGRYKPADLLKKFNVNDMKKPKQSASISIDLTTLICQWKFKNS